MNLFKRKNVKENIGESSILHNLHKVNNSKNTKLGNIKNPFCFGNKKTLTDLLTTLMESDYTIEVINDNEKRYIKKSKYILNNKGHIYYIVSNVYMEELEYNIYVEKRLLNERLTKNLPLRKEIKIKGIKI